MNNEKISTIDSIFLIIIVMITHIILNLPNSILTSSGSAAVLNVIYVSVIILLFFLIINKLFSPFPNKDIIDVSEYVGGPVLKVISTVIYSVYLAFSSSVLILNFSETLRVIYFQNASTWIIVSLFIVTAVLSNKFGFKNIAKVNTLFIPIILLSVIIIFFASSNEFELDRFYPILGYGVTNTFVNGLSNIFSFGGIVYIFFIRPNLTNQNSYKKVGIISIIISALYLLLSVFSIQMLFPFVAQGTDILSVYMSTRTIQFGSFFQRTDALFIFIWIFSFLSYLSVIIVYIVKMNKKTFSIKNSSPLIYLSALIIFLFTFIPQNTAQVRFAETVIYKYCAIFVVFIYSFIILFIGYLKNKKKSLFRKKALIKLQ